MMLRSTALVNTGVHFVPNDSFLEEFSQGLSSMDNAVSDELHEDNAIDEIDYIIKYCDNNNAPGLDGLCYKFYKSTWEMILTLTKTCSTAVWSLYILLQTRGRRVAGLGTAMVSQPIRLILVDWFVFHFF